MWQWRSINDHRIGSGLKLAGKGERRSRVEWIETPLRGCAPGVTSSLRRLNLKLTVDAWPVSRFFGPFPGMLSNNLSLNYNLRVAAQLAVRSPAVPNANDHNWTWLDKAWIADSLAAVNDPGGPSRNGSAIPD
jgi:hypothetical protein